MNRFFIFTGLIALGTVAQSLGGTLQFSNTPSGSGVPMKLNAVAYGSNTFVIVGVGRTNLYSSLPAGGWNRAVTFPAKTFLSATFGSGKFVVGTTNFGVLSSTDGMTWKTNSDPFLGNAYVSGLAFNTGSNGTFMAVPSFPANFLPSYWSTNLTSWTQTANVAGPAYYNGLTSLTDNTNGFATCGSGGIIRVSSNSGRSWTDIVAYNGDDSYVLNGIASGDRKLVAVGTGAGGSGGTIKVLTNTTGAAWSTLTNVSDTVALNAVAYTGNGFIVVGNNGRIRTSTNGVNWVTETNLTTNNLYGIAFATSGSLSNIAILVGASGTIVIGGILPTAVVSGSTTICYGNSTTVQAALGGSAGPWNVTWSSNDVVVATHNSVTSPTDTLNVNNALVTATYTVSKLVDANTLFSGTNLTGNAIVTVNPFLAATVAAAATNCASSPAMFLNGAGVGGTPGYTYSWSPATDLNNANLANPTATLPPGTSRTYTLIVTDSSASHCTATNSVTVTVNPILAVSVAPPATICANSGTNLNGSATGGTPGYTYSWTPVTYLDNPSIAKPTATPPSGTMTTYTLVVTDSSASHCTATNSVTVTVNPQPAAPTNPVNQTGCFGVTNAPLSVQPVPGATVDWYAVAAGGIPLVSGTNSYTPADTSVALHTYFAESRNLSTSCTSSNRTPVTLTIQSCPFDLALNLVGGNPVVGWYGNYVLQSSTNLSPPWLTLTQGTGGISNSWPVLSQTPYNFFRLYAPTN